MTCYDTPLTQAAGYVRDLLRTIIVLQKREIFYTKEKLGELIDENIRLKHQLAQGIDDKDITIKADTIKHDLYWKGSVQYVDELVAEIKRLRERDCHTCNGIGFDVASRDGITPIQMQCHDCFGTGKLPGQESGGEAEKVLRLFASSSGSI